MLLLLKIINCQPAQAPEIYGEIILQLEYIRVEDQPSLMDQRVKRAVA